MERPAEPVVTVRGQAELRCPPDLATVRLTVQSRGKGADAVRRELATGSQQVREVLGRVSEVVESSATTAIHVSAVFAEDGRPRVTGYQGSFATSVVLNDPEALGRVLPELLSVAGAELDGPTWSLRRDNPVHAQARRAAIDDGRRRAQDYASAFGSTLVGLLEVSDLEERGGFPHVAMRSMAFAQAEPAFDVEPQEQTVTGQVTLRFVISAPDLTD